jgi:alanine-glyoxylate transaminase/serine-glyoxylate transaminase/serine-pyruvate transaminase
LTASPPAGHSADEFRQVVLDHFNMPLGTGLGRLQNKVFRIGHLGDFNDLLVGTLSGVEMGWRSPAFPIKGRSGHRADYLLKRPGRPTAAQVTSQRGCTAAL